MNSVPMQRISLQISLKWTVPYTVPSKEGLVWPESWLFIFIVSLYPKGVSDYNTKMMGLGVTDQAVQSSSTAWKSITLCMQNIFYLFHMAVVNAVLIRKLQNSKFLFVGRLVDVARTRQWPMHLCCKSSTSRWLLLLLA